MSLLSASLRGLWFRWRNFYVERWGDIQAERDRRFHAVPPLRRPTCLSCQRPLWRYGERCRDCRRHDPTHPDYPTP